MPEIGYWKYVRFNDNEPQYWGTDDDIVQLFDSADDRLEFRMKKDIRFEDDAGGRILVLQKATRTLSGFKMTGDLEIEKAWPALILDTTSGDPGFVFQDNGTSKLVFRYSVTGDYLYVYDVVEGAIRFMVTRTTGSITKVGDINMGGNLLKNAKLGTDLKTNNYHIYDGVSGNTGMLKVGAGTSPDHTTGGTLYTYGIGHATAPGKVLLIGGKATGGDIGLGTYNAALTAFLHRIYIGQGDDPDIDIRNAKLDFHDQTLDPTVGAEVGHIIIRVGGIDRKLKVYAVS